MKNDIVIIERGYEITPVGQHKASPKKCCGCSKNETPLCFPSTSFFILANSSNDGFFISDDRFEVLFINTTLKAVLNNGAGEREALATHSVCEFLHPDDLSTYASTCRSILCGHMKTSFLDIRILKENGAILSVILLMESIVYNNRTVVLNVLHEKSPSSCEKTVYQKMVDAYPEIALVMDNKGGVLAANNRLLAKTGKSSQEIMNQGLSSCIPTDNVVERKLMVKKAISTGEPVSFTDCEKNQCTIEHFIAPIKNSKGDIEQIAIFCRDISHHIEAEKSNQLLSRRLLSAIEEERKKIAYELHDECGQLVTMVGLGLSSIQKALPDHLEHLRCMCGKYMDIVERLGTHIKNMSSDLHPDLIDNIGLIPAISWYLRTFFTGVPSIVHTFRCTVSEKSFGPKIDIALYRVIQESLNNIVRHAHAGHVLIELGKTSGILHLVIEDNGAGFQLHDYGPSIGSKRMGLGLLSMKERVASVDGRFSLESCPGKGTKITVDIVLAENGSKDEHP
ncbi:MAG: ATP-binding protein [Desulfobacteraceae bacterium]